MKFTNPNTTTDIFPLNLASVTIICCSFSHIFAQFSNFAFTQENCREKSALCFNCKRLADCAIKCKEKTFSTCIIKCTFFSFCLIRDLQSAGEMKESRDVNRESFATLIAQNAIFWQLMVLWLLLLRLN